MQGTAKTSTFSVESLISKESFESRTDGQGSITLPKGPLGSERTRTSPSFTSSITLPRPLSLDGVSAGHSSAFCQTSQSPLSGAAAFAITPRNTDHHSGKPVSRIQSLRIQLCQFIPKLTKFTS